MPADYSGPEAVPEEEQLFSRPAFLNEKIRKLLSTGTALDLRTKEGDECRQCMTPGELYSAMELPYPECVGFDGVNCDACRGLFRFSQCPNCHGAFDPAIHGWPAEPPCTDTYEKLREAEAVNKANGEAYKKTLRGTAWSRFYWRVRGAWDVLTGSDDAAD